MSACLCDLDFNFRSLHTASVLPRVTVCCDSLFGCLEVREHGALIIAISPATSTGPGL